MINLIYIFLAITLITSEFKVCTCAPDDEWEKEFKEEFKSSEDIFIGEVLFLNEDGNQYKVKICEVFKGDLKIGQVIYGENSRICPPVVDKKGQWLFFGEYLEHFHQNTCGMTTNINDPNQIPPPPPPPSSELTPQKMKELVANWKKESQEIVQEQIEYLRRKRNQN
jgi:hypothetical protein